MAAAEQQHQEQQWRPSPLLSLLDALGDAAAGQLLMRRLHTNGCAGSAALACNQLCVLCQSSQPGLYFRAGALGYASAALVPERFPACSSAALVIASKEDAVYHLPELLLELARLPALSQLALYYTAALVAAGSAAAVALGVRMAALQLPRLRALELIVTEACVNSRCVLLALACATQLTRLEFTWVHAEPDDDESDDDGGSKGLQLWRLAALSSLTGLQHLKVEVLGVAPERASCSFLASLSRLTHLSLPLVGNDGLEALTALSSLRYLQVIGALDSDGAWPSLNDAACGALGQLSMLTYLGISYCDGTVSAPFLSALRGLQALQYVDVWCMTPATLAALSGLTGLTRLYGAWCPAAEAGEQQTAAVCSSVREVVLSCDTATSLTGSHMPWSSLPAVRFIFQCNSWSPCELLSISTHCPQLTALTGSIEGPSCSLCYCPDVQRTEAISGLSRLQGLRRLSWNVACDIELAALAALSQVRTLTVTMPAAASTATLMGLAQLGAARQQHTLQLNLHQRPQLECEPSVAHKLLCDLKCLSSLSLVGTEQQVAVFEAALQEARAAGLAVPAQVSIRVV